MNLRARIRETVNTRAIEYLTARSAEQRERFLDLLTVAVIDDTGAAGTELRIAVDHAINRATAERRIR